MTNQTQTDRLAEVLWPATCDGVEQDAFEEWAKSERMDMSTHTIHWLFLNSETNAARKAWKAGLLHAADRAKGATQSLSTDLANALQRVEQLEGAQRVLKESHDWLYGEKQRLENALKDIASRAHANLSRAENYPDPCEVCNGDCAGANPPVIFCPMKDAALTTGEESTA